jgi:2-polyprenyl-3-methyl-5-hydroxy-6-metoxy-1,4-benzoquinol methylase
MENGRIEAESRSNAWGIDGFGKLERFGVWLSELKTKRMLGPLEGKNVADFGCGYQGGVMRFALDVVASVTLVDVTLDPELKARPNVVAIEGILPDVLEQVPAASLDAIICNNVVEHVWERRKLLSHVRRTLKPGGRAFINVPSWRGKWFLEFAAFRLGLTDRREIDDHKAYFDPKDLWHLLVEAGFKPLEIRCQRHKLGLNTFALCTVAD